MSGLEQSNGSIEWSVELLAHPFLKRHITVDHQPAL